MLCPLPPNSSLLPDPAGGQEGTLADFNQKAREQHPTEGSTELGGAPCLLHPPSVPPPGLGGSKRGPLPAPMALSCLQTHCPHTPCAHFHHVPDHKAPKSYHTTHPLVLPTQGCQLPTRPHTNLMAQPGPPPPAPSPAPPMPCLSGPGLPQPLPKGFPLKSHSTLIRQTPLSLQTQMP